MNVTVGAATDIGRARERNEDAYLTEHPLYAVADGMGGHRAGDVASSLALETLQHIADRREWDRLAEQVKEANRAVFGKASGDRALSGMGTTLTAAVTGDREVRLVHVGDSRAYLLRDGEFRLLTEDHTLVHRMVQEGRLTEEEAGVHPQRSILTRALGVEEDVKVDERSLDVQGGDRILLCTDGLTAMVRDESIAEVLTTSSDPQEAAEKLVDMANRAGGLDNITVLVLDFGPDAESTRSATVPPTSRAEDRGTRESVRPEGPRPGPAERGDTMIGATWGEALSPQQSGEDTVVTGVGGDTVVVPQSTPDTRIHPPVTPRRFRRPPRRRLLLRVLVWFLAVAAVVALAWVGVNLYLDRQWYVGVENGHVAIFQGIPTEILGVDLHEVAEETSLSASDARRLGPWSGLQDGITVDSRSDAEAIVAQIRQDLEDQSPKPRTAETQTPETQTPKTETPEAPAG